MDNDVRQRGTAGLEAVLEFCWHYLVYFLAAIVFSGFSGEYWLGLYPAAGATALILFAIIPVIVSSSTPIERAVRAIVPYFLCYLFYTNADDSASPFLQLQQRLGIANFILVFVATLAAIYFSASEQEPEESSASNTKPNSRKGATGAVSSDKLDLNQPQASKPGLKAFERIVGQDHVIAPLREIAKITSSGIRVGKENAPHAVLLFLGPTGVGKTEAAIALAEAVYGTKEAMIRFDMGQFTDSHQASRFYGPPPGYVGFEEGGQLTRAVARKPYSVVLLDEVEKAHPQIWDAFLPVFDEGYIVDGSNNQRVDMTNTIIVLTSNLLAAEEGLHLKSSADIKEAVQGTGAFRPELLGRINEILIFQALSEQSVAEILQRRLDAALWSLAAQGISITVAPGETEEMVQQIRSAKFGVRQIDDVVRKYLRSKIADEE